jgi:hypothetical protein
MITIKPYCDSVSTEKLCPYHSSVCRLSTTFPPHLLTNLPFFMSRLSRPYCSGIGSYGYYESPERGYDGSLKHILCFSRRLLDSRQHLSTSPRAKHPVFSTNPRQDLPESLRFQMSQTTGLFIVQYLCITCFSLSAASRLSQD